MSATAVLRRAELVAKVAGVKLMIAADFGLLPSHVERWKNYRDKREIQFLHVLPCRCGKLLSSNTACSCTEHIIHTYQHRNRRHFYEEGYSMYLEIREFDGEVYTDCEKKVHEHMDKILLSVAPQREMCAAAKELLSTAKKRWEDMEIDKVVVIANAIAAIGQKSYIEKVHVLEALTYRYSARI